MKPFIYSIFFFLITNTTFSQTSEVILKKSFNVDENTVLDLDLDNVSVVFEESTDNKIHFDYCVIFRKYSKRKRKKVLEQVNSKITNNNNLISLEVKNTMFMGEIYNLDVSKESLFISFKDFMKNKSEQLYSYKTKNSLLKEISFSEGSYLKDFIKKNKDKYKSKNANKNIRFFKQLFTIKVPKNVKIRLKALHSNITFNYDLVKPTVVNTFKGHLKFKKLLSKENNFNLINGLFQTQQIVGGSYSFKDVSKTVIGSVIGAKIVAETSIIEIGEVGKNVLITDFNSKFYLYNFSENFNNFDLKGDYSGLTFYNILEKNFSLNVFGHNTTLNMNDTKTTFGNSKEKKITKILHKKPKTNTKISGNINMELTNGILNIK